MKMRSSTSKVILHCSYTPIDMDVDAERIRGWHVAGRAWSDIGYHGLTHPNGKIEWGRDIEVQGAHTAGQNHDSIGWCLIGGAKRVTINGQSQLINACTVLEEQLKSTRTTIRYLMKMYPSIKEVKGHYEYSDSKTCPNFDATHWWETGEVKEILK